MYSTKFNLECFHYFFLSFYFYFFNGIIVALWYHVSFCCTTWISYIYELLSHHTHPVSLGCQTALIWAPYVIQQLSIGFPLLDRLEVHPHHYNWLNSFLFMAKQCFIVYRCHNFFTHSSVDGDLGCFHVLAIVNSAATTLGVHVFLFLFFSIMLFSAYLLTSGIAGT